MKQTAAISAILLFFFSCGEERKIVVCTKDQCCCPDSVVIDITGGSYDYSSVQPVILDSEARLDVINTINLAAFDGERTEEHEYIIRAFYPGGSVPRVFKVQGRFVREDFQEWYDTGIDNFGAMLYNGEPIEKY